MDNPFNWQKEAELAWDDRANFWNKRSVSMWDNGSKIVDIGCGDGYGTYKLHQAGYDITGVDISIEMIRRAKKRLNDDEVQFLQGDITNLPFKRNSLDGAMIINVLEWTEVPAKALKEMQRVLKRTGLLCVGILGPTAGPRANGYKRIYGEKVICNTMMPWEFRQLAIENNFEYVDGFGVYKEGVKDYHYKDLSLELKQALTFMWVFMLRKVEEP